ncbi:MAG: spondin domain-containing protein [Gaiellales bacterium]
MGSRGLLTVLLALAGGGIALSIPSPAAAGSEETFRYRVTIKNLGRSELTPLVWGAHTRSARLFEPGRRASPGVEQLAEDGATGPLLAALRRQRGVGPSGVAARTGPGKRMRFTFATGRPRLRFSWASMVVCSNDAFVGQSNIKLPSGKVGSRTKRRLVPWDAGTERNNERASAVPCLGAHGVGPRESRKVRRHPGISGNGDLVNARHGWDRYQARITIRRVG